MPKAPEVIATGSSIDARYRAAGAAGMNLSGPAFGANQIGIRGHVPLIREWPSGVRTLVRDRKTIRREQAEMP